MRRRKWQDYYVKGGGRGPMVWQAKHITVYPADEQDLPFRPYHLPVARNRLAASMNLRVLRVIKWPAENHYLSYPQA